jgi:hypothetical protein
MLRRYLRLGHGYTAAHPDGTVSYTTHELRHVCASLLIASGASDMQVTRQIARCLEVEVASQGRTVDKALANLREALELYFEDQPAPDAPEPIVAPVEVRLSA